MSRSEAARSGFCTDPHTRAPHEGAEGYAEEQTVLGTPSSEKKPSAVAAAVLIAFPGIFFLFGMGFLIPFFVWPALRVVDAQSWTELRCEIVSSEVRTHPGEDSATYSIDTLFRYEIDGREYRSNRYQFMSGSSSGYESKARIVQGLPPGSTTTCFVDPDDPHEAVIERGLTGDYLFGIAPLIFTLIGVGGLVLAVIVLRDAKRDAGRPAWAAPTGMGDAPTLHGSYGTYAPQTMTGPLALEPVNGPLGKLGCAVVAALLWNGFISIFVWQIIQSWRSGTKEWFVILVLSPFVLIGALLLVSVPYSVLALLNPRPRVRLTPGSLRVGESAQLDWELTGFSGRVRHLNIWLEATEITTRHSDSSIHIQTEALDTPTIQVLDLGRDRPLQSGAVTFDVPVGTPATSEGDTAVRWKLKLHGDIAYWPDVHEEFEVRLVG